VTSTLLLRKPAQSVGTSPLQTLSHAQFAQQVRIVKMVFIRLLLLMNGLTPRPLWALLLDAQLVTNATPIL